MGTDRCAHVEPRCASFQLSRRHSVLPVLFHNISTIVVSARQRLKLRTRQDMAWRPATPCLFHASSIPGALVVVGREDIAWLIYEGHAARLGVTLTALDSAPAENQDQELNSARPDCGHNFQKRPLCADAKDSCRLPASETCWRLTKFPPSYAQRVLSLLFLIHLR